MGHCTQPSPVMDPLSSSSHTCSSYITTSIAAGFSLTLPWRNYFFCLWDYWQFSRCAAETSGFSIPFLMVDVLGHDGFRGAVKLRPSASAPRCTKMFNVSDEEAVVSCHRWWCLPVCRLTTSLSIMMLHQKLVGSSTVKEWTVTLCCLNQQELWEIRVENFWHIAVFKLLLLLPNLYVFCR